MKIFQIKIDLHGSKPNITRTVLIPDTMNFADLHHVIQGAMGWYNSHLHQFDVNGLGISSKREFDDFEDEDSLDGAAIKLSEYLREGSKIGYEYDFGDGWQHKISVQKALAPDPNLKYPTCIKGKNACPPEDCGGIWGYAELLETLADPTHEEYEDMREWLGLDDDDVFDPTFFDLEEANDDIAGMFS